MGRTALKGIFSFASAEDFFGDHDRNFFPHPEVPLALDERLNQRVRKILKGRRGIAEKKMFGGVCFMQNGNMLCGCDTKHGLMLRVGPEKYEEALSLKHCREMDITGRPLRGFVLVDPAGWKTDSALARWIELGIEFTSTLPKKKKKSPRAR